MTTFLLKIIALCCMIIDHIAVAFGSGGWNIIKEDIVFVDMRTIGRISFPVFAFLIANGWKYTKDKRKYFLNLTLFASLSQVPYTLSSYITNVSHGSFDSESAFEFVGSELFLIIPHLLFIIFTLFIYYYLIPKVNGYTSILILASALFIRLFFVRIHGIQILDHSLNIFYTLALGIYTLYCYNYFIPFRKHHLKEYLLLLHLVSCFFFINIQYGIPGVLLILGLHILKNKYHKGLLIILWGFITYEDLSLIGTPFFNWPYFKSVILSAFLLLFYNEKKGPGFKYFFYAAYPVHLVLIGLVNIWLLLK